MRRQTVCAAPPRKLVRLPVAPCLGARAEGRAQRRPTLPWKRPGHDSSRVRRLTAVMVALAVIRVARRCSGAHQRMSQKGGQAESLNALQMMQTWPKKTRRCLRRRSAPLGFTWCAAVLTNSAVRYPVRRRPVTTGLGLQGPLVASRGPIGTNLTQGREATQTPWARRQTPGESGAAVLRPCCVLPRPACPR